MPAVVQTNRARCRPPLDDKEVTRIAESAVRYVPPSVLLAANRTDLGNAERFAAFAGDRFRYVHAWSSWLFFDGKRWVKDADGGVVRWCRDMLRAMAVEARAIEVPEERGPLVKHALDSESSHRVNATSLLAQALLPIASEALDQQPDLVNCDKGTGNRIFSTPRAPVVRPTFRTVEPQIRAGPGALSESPGLFRNGRPWMVV